MRTSSFSLDALDNAVFEAYTNEENWNGWACPYFSFEGAQHLAEAWRGRGWPASYNEARDVFAFWMQPEEEPESFAAVEVDGRKLYPIGAFSWMWEENSTARLSAELGTDA